MKITSLTWGKSIRLGSNIENYEVVEKIGKGKYSEVYIGIQTQNDRKVVIKVLKPVKKSKIRREIKILKVLSTVKHPNIVQLMDIVQDQASQSYSLVSPVPLWRFSSISSTKTSDLCFHCSPTTT